jgi:hypothetical protein
MDAGEIALLAAGIRVSTNGENLEKILMQNRALWFIFRLESALHLNIENLAIYVLSLEFIVLF